MPNSNFQVLQSRSRCSTLGSRSWIFGMAGSPLGRNSKFWPILAMFCVVHRVALLPGKALVALTTAFLIRPSATAQSVSLEPISRTRVSSCFVDREFSFSKP